MIHYALLSDRDNRRNSVNIKINILKTRQQGLNACNKAQGRAMKFIDSWLCGGTVRDVKCQGNAPASNQFADL